MGITDDLIFYDILKATMRRAHKISVRWRRGLKPIWAGLLVLLVGWVSYTWVPTLVWLWGAGTLMGVYVLLWGKTISEEATKPFMRLVPRGLDKGETGSLDSKVEQIYLGVLFVTVFGWLTARALIPLSELMLWVWVTLVAVFGGLWYTNQRFRVAGRSTSYAAQWPKVAATIDDFHDSHVVEAIGRGGSRELTVELRRAQTAGSVVGLSPQVASFYGLRTSSVSIHPDESHARRVIVHIVPRDPWAETLDHPKPEPGSRLLKDLDGFVMGMDASGRTDTYKLQHTLVVGQSGSGKSAWAESLLIHLIAQRDVALLGIDMAGGATLGSWATAFNFPIATDEDEAIDTLEAVLRGVRYREKVISDAKIQDPKAPDSWEVTETEPAIVLLIDEFPDLIAAAKTRVVTLLDRIAKRARKAKLILVFLAQNGSKPDLGSKEMQGQLSCTVGLRLEPHSSRVLWKDLERIGWGTAGLGTGQYKIKDADHKTPVTYKGFYVPPVERHALIQKKAKVIIDPGTWAAMTEEPEQDEDVYIKPITKHQRLITLLEEIGPTDAKTLADRLGLHITTLYSQLRDCKEQGAVTSDKRGEFRVTLSSDNL